LIKPLDKLLEDFQEDIKDATINIDYFQKEKKYKINFNMWLPGKKHVFAEESNEVLLSALTDLREDLKRQLKEYKERISVG
jgi:ribosome-associated translation inhibitor RaiA